VRLPNLAGLTASRPARLIGGVARQYSEHNLSDHAAAVTYWGFLALFPALIVIVALVGLIGTYPETYDSISSTLREAAPGSAVDTINNALDDAVRSRRTATGLLGVGLLLSLYSASSGTGAALRAVNEIYGVAHAESFLRAHLKRLGLTICLGAMLILAFAAMLVAGPLFSSISDEAGIDESVSGVVSLLRWPVGLAALAATALLLYRVGADRAVAVRRLLPGACAASLLWAVASAGFSVYVSHFGSYDATYGSLGAVIVLLIWMWIGNLALLAGAALNVELEQIRAEEAGG
jgi:membrane protein